MIWYNGIMRKLATFITFILFIMLGGWLTFPANAVDTENFYFSDFTADYYLLRDAQGVSHLKVVENFTAVFPDYNQNKGFCRDIAFTNQGGVNVTLPNLSKSNITVLRNGSEEPIYSIDKYSDYFEVCTGDDNYVLGEQVYTFEYEFEKVVTDFEDFQELYWDTNGNGWVQRFDAVTARLHFVGEVAEDYDNDVSCYVGKYGDKGLDRCTVTEISDGFKFQAKNLTKFENLTFAIRLKPGSFVVPEPEKSYVAVIYGAVIIIICVIWLCMAIRRYLKVRGKIVYYKGIFVKPEYQPDSRYSLAEMAELYIGKKKDIKVGMLLDLVVRRKISLVKKSEKKNDWEIVVNDLEGVSEEERDLLAILRGGVSVDAGERFEVRPRTASTLLVKVNKNMETALLEDLKRDGLVESKYRIGARGGNKRNGTLGDALSVIVAIIVEFAVIAIFALGIYVAISDEVGVKEIVYLHEMMIAVGIVIFITITINTILKVQREMVEYHTEKGLMASRYMDGLRMYIEMAEAERVKMLQSVNGADVSPEGIVKLYEKLLPYAAVFGLEESWMNEMAEYCKVEEVAEPDYLRAGITASEISRMTRTMSRYATNSTVMSTSGGGSSSGFSGGGGGGFSGGGGGGGGGHGR